MKRVCFWALTAFCAVLLVVACCFIAALIGDTIALRPTKEVVTSSPVEETIEAITEEGTTASPANIIEVVMEEFVVSLPVETEETTKAVENVPVSPEDAWVVAYQEARAHLNPNLVMEMALVISGEAWRPATHRTAAAACVWGVLNQVDAGDYESIWHALANPGNLTGYWGLPADFEPSDIALDIAADVLARYQMECEGWEDVGRALPKGYTQWHGTGRINYFFESSGRRFENGTDRLAWAKAHAWDWSLPSPYED